MNNNEITHVLSMSNAKNYTDADFLKVFNKDTITLEDFAVLLSAEISNDSLEKLAQKARSLTIKRFGKIKGLYIPLYLSNVCSNSCVYCGFRKDNIFPRKTLTFDEIKSELTQIFDKGFRNILLVSGEWDNTRRESLEYLVKSIEIAKNIGFHSIAVELGTFQEDASKLLHKAGAESFVLYQETYHRETYKNVHISGAKRDYDYRLSSQEIALKSGFRKVSFGFLCGLYDVKFEALAMFSHIQDVRKKFWQVELGMSLPRITNAHGVDSSKFHVDDKIYARILMAFRLAFPDITISLSTREPAEFRDGLADICVTHLSVESSTMPGGYHDKNDENLEQFSVVDSRKLEDMKIMLEKKGYTIHLKDWESVLNN